MLVPSWLLLILVSTTLLGAVCLGFLFCHIYMNKNHPEDYALTFAKNEYLEIRVGKLEEEKEKLKTELDQTQNTILTKIMEKH